MKVLFHHHRLSAAISALVIGSMGLAMLFVATSPSQTSIGKVKDSGVIHAVPLSAQVSTTLPHLIKPPNELVAIPGFSEKTIDVNGVLRHYYLQAPGTGPSPLVIALHGLDSTPSWMAENTGLAAQARASHVALAVPVTLNGAWNDGRLGPKGPDDQAFILDIVHQSVATKIADPKRIVISGFSNGAEMSLTMASLHPTIFSAVVSISGELPSASGSARPSAPIPAFFTHGLSDKVQPYDGRSGNGKLFNPLLSEESTVSDFVAADKAKAPVTKTLPHGPAASGAIQEITYPAGPGGAPVTLYKLPGVGHKWPAPASHASSDNVVPAGLNASQLITTVATNVSR